MKITTQVKLQVTPEQKKSLLNMLSVVNEVCSGMSSYCFQERIFNKYNIHHIFYHQIRECYNIPSQMVIRAIAKTVDAYGKDKKTLRTFKKYGAIAFDSRILTWKENEVSITLLNAREKIPFVCGEKQKQLLKHQKGESDLVYRGGEFFLYTTCDIEEPDLINPTEFLGVDMGIANIATDSKGTHYSGSHVTSLRKRYRKLRARLQSKGTKSAKRLLKKRKRKESRFAKDVNHCISKNIVETAQRHSFGIALEDLEGITKRVTVRKKQRYALHSWSFYDLRQKITYKAKLAGVRVVLVDPRYTSQGCSQCGYIKKSNRKSQSKFSCGSCGYTAHADHNAACNIASRADVNRPYVSVAQSVRQDTSSVL